MASGSSGSQPRTDNSRSDNISSRNFVASNMGLDIPLHYASQTRGSPSYTSFFDPDYFVRPTPNSHSSSIHSSPASKFLPHMPSQRPADTRGKYSEQGDGYEFSTRNNCRKMSEKENSTLSCADQIHFGQAHNLRYSMPKNNESRYQLYQVPNSVYLQPPTEQSCAYGKSPKIPYKRSYVSSCEEQSRSNAPTPAKKACQQNIGHASMKSETARSPLDFGLDLVNARSQERKIYTENVPTTPDQKSPRIHVAANTCEPTFPSRPFDLWSHAFSNYPAKETVSKFPEHWKSDTSIASKPTDAAFLPQFSSYQPETPKDASNKLIQSDQAMTYPAQTTSKHPGSAESSDDAFSSQASTPTKLSENGLPLINKKDVMTFSSWRNKNKFVVYPGESGADLEKTWLRSINDHTGQNPTELDRRRFYAMRSKYPYEMLGELNEVLIPDPMDEIVVDDETSNGQRVTPFLGWEQRTSSIFSKVQSSGGPARDVLKEERSETDSPQWGVPISTGISTAIELTISTKNPVDHVDKGTMTDHSLNNFVSSSERHMTIGKPLREIISSDKASTCPTIDQSNGKATETPKERERNTSSNSSSNLNAQASPVQLAKPEVQKDIKSDTKPGWEPGCKPNFGPNKPGSLCKSKCWYCQKLWRKAQDWATSRTQHLDLELNLRSLPQSLRNIVLERLKRRVLVDVEESRWDCLHRHTCAEVEPEAYEMREKASQQKREISESCSLFSRDTIDSCSSWIEAKQGSCGSEQEEGERKNPNDKQDVNRKVVSTKRSQTMRQNSLYRVISWVEMRAKAQKSEAMLTGQILGDVFANQVDGSDEDLPSQSSDSFYSSRETATGEGSATTNDEEEQIEDVVDQEDSDMENVSDSSEWTKAEQGSVSSEDEDYQRVEVSSNDDMDMENASNSSGWTRTSQWLATSEDEDFEII